MVTDSFEGHSRHLIEALRTRLNEAGFGMLCLIAADPYLSDLSSDRDRLDALERITRRFGDLHATILLSALLANHLSVEELAALARDLPCALAGRPVVSLGVALPGVPSVTPACEPSLRALMEHMTRMPGRRRFVFLRGFAADAVTQRAETVFRQVLTERGIEIDERLVVEGRYTRADALNAIETLLRDGLDFDAVIATNDSMAASAVVALERYGLTVPGDIIVAGCYDGMTAVRLQPPLTTVRQHIDRQAVAATDLLLGALVSGRPLAPDTHRTISTQLVIRDSSLYEGEIRPDERAIHTALRASEPVKALRRLLKEQLEELPSPYGIDIDELVDAVNATVFGGSNALSLMLGRAFERSPPRAPEYHWNTYLARQLTSLAKHLPSERRRSGVVSKLLLVAAKLDRVKRSARDRARFERSAYRQLQERLLLRLAGCSSRETIWSTLREGLVKLGVERAWMMLYENTEDPDAPPEGGALLCFALDDPSGNGSDERFAPGDILPRRLRAELEHGTLSLSPLAAEDSQLGYLLLDPGRLHSLELAAITASVALALRHVYQIADLEHRAEEVRQAVELSVRARHDSLTGLPNRALFHENLEAAIARARADGDELALLFMDLDGFKAVNDTFGHAAGDQLLKIVAARVRGVLREQDSMARLGGDEFTIIASGSSAEGAERIARDVLETTRQPCRLEEHVVSVTASVGLARYPADGEETETLIRSADTAMYHAKASGKSCHALYRPTLDSETQAEMELCKALRRALGEKEERFRLCYQPKVNLGDGRLSGFEALIRWRQEERDGPPSGEIGPARFVPVAERCGLIDLIDAFALDESCRQARRWQEAGLATAVSVNLSVKRLQEKDIVEQVERALRLHRLMPYLLELEITETAAMDNVEENIVKLEALRALGVRVAIDDFGTGYSSLNYLRRLPVSSLKVDRSFLSDIATEADTTSADAAIVRAVVALGRSLDFRVVAEGVENAAQLAFLRGLGCHEGQGYRFGRPLEVDAATTYLQRDRSARARRESPLATD